MRLIYWILIIIAGFLFPLIFMIIFPVAILNLSWWWFFGTLITEFVIGLVIGIIFLMLKLKKGTEAKLELDIKDAKAKAIHEMKYDEDNPDNFKVDEVHLIRVGKQGVAPTPILHLIGLGTENNDKRHALVNLNNPQKEITFAIDPTDSDIERLIRLLAEHPAEEDIREERVMGVDELGRPITTIKTRRPSSILEQKQEKEKQEADFENAL